MNLTQGALFRHFSNKEAIWRAVIEWVAERLLARIDRSVEGIDSPLAAMEAIFMSHAEFVAEHPGVPRMIFGELQRAEPLALGVIGFVVGKITATFAAPGFRCRLLRRDVDLCTGQHCRHSHGAQGRPSRSHRRMK